MTAAPEPAPASRSSAALPGPTPVVLPAQALAEQVRDAMYASDHASQGLGITVLAIAPGTASLQMVVRQDMVNGHGICHGGLIATLADSAFAFACNSYNVVTVAAGFAIELLAPARLGDVLTAQCGEVSKASRTGVYDTQVHNQAGQRIALFRGRSRSFIGQAVVPA